MVNQTRIKIDHKEGEVFPNTFPDYDWARAHRKQLLEQYGSGVLLIYKEAVLGTGKTLDDAITDADQKLSNSIDVVTPIIYLLSDRRLPVRYRAIPTQSEK